MKFKDGDRVRLKRCKGTIGTVVGEGEDQIIRWIGGAVTKSSSVEGITFILPEDMELAENGIERAVKRLE